MLLRFSALLCLNSLLLISLVCCWEMVLTFWSDLKGGKEGKLCCLLLGYAILAMYLFFHYVNMHTICSAVCHMSSFLLTSADYKYEYLSICICCCLSIRLRQNMCETLRFACRLHPQCLFKNLGWLCHVRFTQYQL